MNVCVCVWESVHPCVYMRVGMCECVCECKYIRVCMCVCVFGCVCVFRCICVYEFVNLCVCVCVCVWYMRVWMCECVSAYACMNLWVCMCWLRESCMSSSIYKLIKFWSHTKKLLAEILLDSYKNYVIQLASSNLRLHLLHTKVWVVNCYYFKLLISHMRFICFRICLLCSKRVSVVHCL